MTQTKDYLIIAYYHKDYIIEADCQEDAENEARGYLLEDMRSGRVRYDDISTKGVHERKEK